MGEPWNARHIVSPGHRDLFGPLRWLVLEDVDRVPAEAPRSRESSLEQPPELGCFWRNTSFDPIRHGVHSGVSCFLLRVLFFLLLNGKPKAKTSREVLAALLPLADSRRLVWGLGGKRKGVGPREKPSPVVSFFSGAAPKTRSWQFLEHQQASALPCCFHVLVSMPSPCPFCFFWSFELGCAGIWKRMQRERNVDLGASRLLRRADLALLPQTRLAHLDARLFPIRFARQLSPKRRIPELAGRVANRGHRFCWPLLDLLRLR